MPSFEPEATRTEHTPSPPSSPTEQARFVVGTVLARRYRIVGRLGQGGMGEVYRADDLKLGQSVALKFMPEALATDPAWLARFHSEVRTAREVTHPNVCRVHDIGETDGQHFLSMEYVDGEDLASLLRRIGRLPKDKGIEIARQLCAGLAAAHDRGVLHRDLKPANVMIDGRGRVRITDFGLAGLATQVKTENLLAGTPAYMSPEQFAGREPTVRSDLYSLGLILYEVFTGRRPFKGDTLFELARVHQSQPPPPPSEVAGDLDPTLERIILRCLEKDPQARPPSAVAVSAALPGSDPLAAALAAGVTPSPEMVAAAGEAGGLRRTVALLLFAAVVVTFTLAYAVAFVSRQNLLQRVPLDRSPEVLADRAREMIERLRGSAAPADRAYGLSYDDDIVRHIAQRDPSPDKWDRLATGQPAAIYFWYRESPVALAPASRVGVVSEVDPPYASRGMVSLNLDLRGRLIGLRAISPRFDDAKAEAPAPDWAALFAAAGLDLARFQPARALWVPLPYADTRGAWDGVYSDRPEVPIHVEAAAYRGKPVYFEVLGPWRQTPVPGGPGFVGFIVLSAVVLAAGVFLARLNLRRGRGDRRGAMRLAAFVFACRTLQWLFTAGHVADPLAEWSIFTRAMGQILFDCAAFWIYYIAVEPYVRRLWPEALVSWSRLLAGRWRDPLVGRDVLIGILAANVIILLGMSTGVMFDVIGGSPLVSTAAELDALADGRALAAGIFYVLMFALQLSFLLLVSLLLLRIVIRSRAALALGFVALQVAVYTGLMSAWFGGGLAPIYWLALSPFILGITVIAYVVLTRFGLLALAAMLLPIGLGLHYPLITPTLSAWYAGVFLVPVVVLLGLAVYGFHTALAGQPLFRDEILAD